MNTGAYPIPCYFEWLMDQKLIRREQILFTDDGFCMVLKSLSSILISRGIETVPDREGRSLECKFFFDDWFFFSVQGKDTRAYGLVKMREQENDRERGILGDGDTPGVTVSFIAFDTELMKRCLENPTPENRRNLGMEINRVVAYPKQNHHPVLKEYFVRPQAQGPYLVAQVYVRHMASFSKDGRLPVPEAYRQMYQKREGSARYSRIPEFLEENNRSAGERICDHRSIFIRDPDNLSPFECLAILATHTGNVSLHSFAAEVRFHAMFLHDLAKIRIPFLGCPYASAVRADMSIGDKELQGPTPYYDLSGRLVLEQMKHHPDILPFAARQEDPL